MGNKKKRRTKKQAVVRLWVVLLIFIALIIGTIYGTVKLVSNHDKNKENGNFNNFNLNKLEETIVANTQEETTTSVSLVMVGDNLIHSSVYRDANRLAGGGKNQYDFKQY